MPFRPLSSLIPTAEELLELDEEKLAMVLLLHLQSYIGQPNNSVFQQGMFSQGNFLGMQMPSAYGHKAEYGDQQLQVNHALQEAWSWLEQNGFLMRDPSQPAPWFRLTRKAEGTLGKFEQWEKLGLDRVRSDLQSGGVRDIGGPPANRELAWLWTGIKSLQANGHKQRGAVHGTPLISEKRLEELRGLKSSDFDFKKLIRFCEEINTNYREGCYLGTAMLTRALLDHVPPIFDKKNFSEVASNYGGKSFRGTMQHLDRGARNIADGHLHGQIRKKETLPEPQQVEFGAGLDVLLGEIIRLTEEKHGH